MADGDPEDELELPEQAEPLDLEDDGGLDTDEQEPSREDTVDDRGVETQAEQPVGPQPQERQDRQPTRGENRFQTLRNDNQRLNSELADTRRRLDELTSRVNQPPVQRETPAERAARFALLSPEQQMAETLRESEARMTQLAQVNQLQMAETMDRTAFQAKCAVDPLYAKWAPKVEGKIAELRARGQNVEREVALKFLIGEAALERRSSKEGRREVREAGNRVRRQTTRPANSGSDTQAVRRQTQSLERRLENVQI